MQRGVQNGGQQSLIAAGVVEPSGDQSGLHAGSEARVGGAGSHDGDIRVFTYLQPPV